MDQWIIDNAVWLDELGLLAAILLAGLSLVFALYFFKKKSFLRVIGVSISLSLFLLVTGVAVLIQGPLHPFVSSMAQVQRAMKSDINQFTFHTLDGMPKSIGDLNGKPIILNFWGTYCPPCIRELPVLHQIENKFENKLHEVCLTDEPVEKVKRFMEKRPDHPSVMATYDKDQWINLDTFRPLTLLLDKQGKIIRFYAREVSFEELNDLDFDF